MAVCYVSTRELLGMITAMGLVCVVVFFGLARCARGEERGSDEQVRRVIQQGLDEAFEAQVQHLFSNWMKDESGQPARAANGIRKAVRAYRRAIVGVETENLGLAPPVPLPRPRQARAAKIHGSLIE